MEEYHRDSLRELRRMEQETARKPVKKGSILVTLLIVVLFLAAGWFYLKTARPEWIQGLKAWKEEAVSVFRSESEEVHQTVDAALADEAG